MRINDYYTDLYETIAVLFCTPGLYCAAAPWSARRIPTHAAFPAFFKYLPSVEITANALSVAG